MCDKNRICGFEVLFSDSIDEWIWFVVTVGMNLEVRE